jgi:hypothetical protein
MPLQLGGDRVQLKAPEMVLRLRLRSPQLLAYQLAPNDPEHDLLHPAQLRRASHEKGNGIRDLVYN